MTKDFDAVVRRQVILRSLNGESTVDLVREYGMSRQNIYTLVRTATRDAQQKLETAKKDVEFRQSVVDLLEQSDEK